MRSTILKQGDLFAPLAADTPLSREIREVELILAAHLEWVTWIHSDLTSTRGVSARHGRHGMAASCVLRFAFLQRRLNLSTRRLHDLAGDSVLMRDFLGLGPADRLPSRSAVQASLAKVRPATWGRILKGLVQSAELGEFETGRKVRGDCTVTETNIHHPTDSSLLWDCLRIAARLLVRVQKVASVVTKHRWLRGASKHRVKLNFARNQVARRPHYRSLLELCGQAVADLQGTAAKLRARARRTKDPRLAEQSEWLLTELQAHVVVAQRVMDQTRRRVFEGESVPVAEKVFSIHEQHTDLILKGKKAEYGHKIALTGGASGLILDAVIERGNPADVTLTTRQLQRVVELFGEPPQESVFDGGFASRENLDAAKAMGVKRCAFSKGKGLTPEEMAGNRRTYGRLKDFRAGVEGNISDLKRDFGLGRCPWRGWEAFQSWVWSGVIAYNLTKLARLRLARAKRVRAA